MAISQPHDRFFKFLFSDPNQTRSLLEANLPLKLLAKLDLTSLQAEPNSFVDEQLKEHLADLVFTCQAVDGQVVRIVVLLEHKSYVPTYPHLQLLRYLLNLWEQLAAQKKALTPVIPIVFYHGQQNWPDRSFASYVQAEAEMLRPFVPEFEYLLINLQTEDPDTIQTRYPNFYLQKGLLLMKYIFHQEMIEQLDLIFEGFAQQQERERAKEIFRIFISYAEVNKQKSKAMSDKLEELIKSWPIEQGSIASEWVEKGRQEGKVEGEELSIWRLIQRDFPLVEIAAIFETTLEAVEAVAHKYADSSTNEQKP